MRYAQYILLAALLVPGLAQASPSDTGTWRFKVLLDGKPVGYHTFRVARDGDVQSVRVDADFEVKVLFVTLYAYQLDAQEIWQGGCLRQISSQTSVNGERFRVHGERQAGDMEITRSKAGVASVRKLSGCVMTFAYWDPAILAQSRLLNVQTGQYMNVDVQRVGQAAIDVQGRPVTTTQYRLRADKLDIDLWYGPGGEWLKLASKVGHRTLEYQRLAPLPAEFRLADTD